MISYWCSVESDLSELFRRQCLMLWVFPTVTNVVYSRDANMCVRLKSKFNFIRSWQVKTSKLCIVLTRRSALSRRFYNHLTFQPPSTHPLLPLYSPRSTLSIGLLHTMSLPALVIVLTPTNRAASTAAKQSQNRFTNQVAEAQIFAFSGHFPRERASS